jgi:AcrR family transcriptional regulator
VARRNVPFYISSTDAPAKQKILVAALKLFVRDGLCETSVRDIAQASGFTNPALFKHFPSKDALAGYLFESCYLNLYRLLAGTRSSGGPFAAQHVAVIDAYLTALDNDRDAVLYVQENLRHFWPKMTAALRKHSILGEIAALLEVGQAEGAVTRNTDIRLLTSAWVGVLQQFARARFFGEFTQPRAVLVTALEELLTRMLRA